YRRFAPIIAPIEIHNMVCMTDSHQRSCRSHQPGGRLWRTPSPSVSSYRTFRRFPGAPGAGFASLTFQVAGPPVFAPMGIEDFAPMFAEGLGFHGGTSSQECLNSGPFGRLAHALLQQAAGCGAIVDLPQKLLQAPQLGEAG